MSKEKKESEVPPANISEWAESLSWPNRALYAVGEELFDDLVNDGKLTSVFSSISVSECYTVSGLSRLNSDTLDVQQTSSLQSYINRMTENLVVSGDWYKLYADYRDILNLYYTVNGTKNEERLSEDRGESDLIKSFQYFILVRSIQHIAIFKREEIRKVKIRYEKANE